MYYKKDTLILFRSSYTILVSDWYLPELSLLISQSFIPILFLKYISILAKFFYLIRYIPNTVYVSAGAIDISTVSFWRRLLENRNIFYFIDHFFKLTQIYLYERKYVKMANLVTVMSEEDDLFYINYFRHLHTILDSKKWFRHFWTRALQRKIFNRNKPAKNKQLRLVSSDRLIILQQRRDLNTYSIKLSQN